MREGGSDRGREERGGDSAGGVRYSPLGLPLLSPPRESLWSDKPRSANCGREGGWGGKIEVPIQHNKKLESTQKNKKLDHKSLLTDKNTNRKQTILTISQSPRLSPSTAADLTCCSRPVPYLGSLLITQ